MAENENPTPSDAERTAVVPPAPAATPPVTPAATPVQPSGPRLRDTVWNFRSMLAVAIASLLIGGASGAAIVALADGHDGPDRVRIANFGGGGPGFRNGPDENGPFRRFRQDDGMPPMPQLPQQTPTPTAPQTSPGSDSTG